MLRNCIIIDKPHLTYIIRCIYYYARKKLPDPPIINTAQHTYCRIDFQRPYTLDRFCSRYMHGLAYELACSLTYK